MEIDVNILTKEQKTNLYNKLVNKKRGLIDDLEATKRALIESRYLDYMTKREYNSDIISDGLEIKKIDAILETLSPYIEKPKQKLMFFE